MISFFRRRRISATDHIVTLDIDIGPEFPISASLVTGASHNVRIMRKVFLFLSVF